MKYPVLNEINVKKAIEKIESADLRTTSIEELEEYLKPLFTGYQVSVPCFKKSVYVYRGRICDKPKNIRDISYPPPEAITRYGRLNNIGESIFYGAIVRNVPFFELDARVGDTIALSTWKSTDKMILNHVGFTDECKNLFNSNRNLSEIYDFVKEMANFGNLNNFIHSYLASKFTQPVKSGEEYKYKLSIAIVHKLSMGNLINGLLYPTIAMSANADNIALKTDFFDSNMKFVSVEFVKVVEQKSMQYKIDILDSATRLDKNGNILWSGRPLRWVLKNRGEEIVMKSEGGAWVAYNKNGNRIDPE